MQIWLNFILSYVTLFYIIYSGLDSSASASLITLLNNLARGGRTLIATIHQPSALIFEKIDTVYCLEEGRTLYSGPRASLVPALDSAGLRCPPYHNPADFCKYPYYLLYKNHRTLNKCTCLFRVLWWKHYSWIPATSLNVLVQALVGTNI